MHDRILIESWFLEGRKLAPGLFISLALIAMPTIICGCGNDVAPSRATISAMPSGNKVEDNVAALAASVGKLNGDPSPARIEYVMSNESNIYSLAEVPSPRPTSQGDPVVLIEIVGKFRQDYSRLPPGAPAPTGHAILILMHPQTGRSLGWKLLQDAIPIDSLGDVSSVPPSSSTSG